jgi:hypothetical protein
MYIDTVPLNPALPYINIILSGAHHVKYSCELFFQMWGLSRMSTWFPTTISATAANNSSTRNATQPASYCFWSALGGNILKGQCHEIFDPRFFHQSTPPRAPIHRLKPFRIWLRISREIRFGNRQNRLPWCQWDRGSWSSPSTFPVLKYVMFQYVQCLFLL